MTDTSYRNIWRVAFPIILSGVAQNLVNVTDTAFLSRVGLVELGAAGNAGIFYFVLMMFGMGFTIGCQIIIGRRNGEKEYKQIGPVFNHGLFFMLFLSLVLFCIMKLGAPVLLENLTASQAILAASNDYLAIRSYGIPFAFISFLFISFFTGITQTKMLIQVTFLQALSNVLLDYLLIFGHAGLPEMGIQGAALASLISEAIAAGYFIIYTFRKVPLEKYQLLQAWTFHLGLLKRMLKVGSPIMLQNFLALSTWLAFFMIIEQIGERELAISHIVRSIYMVLMIPLFGFSTANSTLVSNLIGSGGSDRVLFLVKRIALICLSFALAASPFTLIFPETIIQIYTADALLIQEVIPVLYVVTAAMAFFSLAFIAFSAVTGTGKTLQTLFIEVVSISIYLLGAYWLGVHLKLPLYLVWCSEFIYFGMMGTLSFFYLKYGPWQSAKI